MKNFPIFKKCEREDLPYLLSIWTAL